MFQLFQINWPPEDYDPEDDEIAKVYTNGGKVSCHHHDHHQHRHRYSHSKSSYDHHHHDDQAPTFTPAYPKTGPSPEKHGYYPGGDDKGLFIYYVIQFGGLGRPPRPHVIL